VGYVVVTAIVVGAYVGVSILLNVFLGTYEIAQSTGFSYCVYLDHYSHIQPFEESNSIPGGQNLLQERI